MAGRTTDTIVKLNLPGRRVVFSTHNIGSLPALLDRARHNKRRSRSSVARGPSRRLSPTPATVTVPCRVVSIGVGCNNTCTFCVVPSLRGKEQDRRPATSLAEVQALVDRGVIGSPCWGRNVNTYGVGSATRAPSPKLLRACGGSTAWNGCVSPAPQRPSPMTSSGRWPQTPKRHAAAPCRLAVRLRPRAQGDAALYRGEVPRHPRRCAPRSPMQQSTDLIVGFPGETEDFAQTFARGRASRFGSAFTLPVLHPGTPAATMEANSKPLCRNVSTASSPCRTSPGRGGPPLRRTWSGGPRLRPSRDAGTASRSEPRAGAGQPALVRFWEHLTGRAAPGRVT